MVVDSKEAVISDLQLNGDFEEKPWIKTIYISGCYSTLWESGPAFVAMP